MAEVGIGWLKLYAIIRSFEVGELPLKLVNFSNFSMSYQHGLVLHVWAAGMFIAVY